MPLGRHARFVLYGALGLAGELVYTAAAGQLVRGTGWRAARTSPLMFPVYGLIAPLYEPLHDALRDRARSPLRGVAYALGFTAIEYGSGRALRRLAGGAPWDYSHARINLHGLIRADYLPLWAVTGLALEPVHDSLTRRGPARRSIEAAQQPRPARGARGPRPPDRRPPPAA